MIPGDLLSACPHRQFHTLPGLLDSRAALSDSYPNALRAKQGGNLYQFYDGLWYDPAGSRTHDLSACPHRQFHTLPGLLDSRAALSDSYPNALRAKQGGNLYQFYDGLWYDPAGSRTHDLPCQRRTR